MQRCSPQRVLTLSCEVDQCKLLPGGAAVGPRQRVPVEGGDCGPLRGCSRERRPAGVAVDARAGLAVDRVDDHAGRAARTSGRGVAENKYKSSTDVESSSSSSACLYELVTLKVSQALIPLRGFAGKVG